MTNEDIVKKIERKIKEKDKDFIVKCDLCKSTIKRNVSFEESVQGGSCIKCKRGIF